MPIIETDQELRVLIEVEVYCNTCGCGLCDETIVKGHQYPQLRVNLCPDCEKGFKDEINDLKEEISKNEDKIEGLMDENEELKNQIKILEKEAEGRGE